MLCIRYNFFSSKHEYTFLTLKASEQPLEERLTEKDQT